MRSNSSRTGLFLMELIIAILFFSLAGAVCTKLFVQSHMISNKSVELNHGVLWAQNVAETFYGCNGNVSQMTELLDSPSLLENTNGTKTLELHFDKDFQPILSKEDTAPAAYLLRADITREENLSTCAIIVINAEKPSTEEPIYTLSVSLFPDKEAVNEK